MAMAGDEEEITVDLSLRDYLSASAERAAKAAEDLKDNIKQLNRQLLTLDKRADKATASLVKLELAMKAFSGTNKDVNASFERVNESVKKYTKNNDDLTKSVKKGEKEGKNFLVHLKKLMLAFKVLTIAATAAKFALMAVGYAIAGAFIGSLIGVAIQNVIMLGAQLAYLAAYAALVPTAIGAMIVSLITLKTAFSGVGAAIKAAMSGDLTKMDAALKKLAKPAQAFVKEIYRWAPAFKNIKKIVQESMFIPLDKEIRPLLEKLVPIFRAEMPQLAKGFGNLFASIMRFFTTKAGGGIFVDLFNAAEKFTGVLSKVMPTVLRGLADVIHAVSDNWDKMSDKFGGMAERFGKWMSRISKDGTLDKWLDTAGTVLHLLGTIATSILDIFANVSKATGGDPLGGLSTVLKAIADFTGTKEGQTAIHDFFQSLATVLAALMPVVLALAKGFADVLAPAIADIAVVVGPLLEQLVPLIVDLVEQLGDPLIAVAKALAPVLGTIIKSLGLFIEPLETIITTLAPYVDEFLQAFAEGIANLAPMWGPLAEGVGMLLQALIPLIPPLSAIIKLLGLELAQIFILLAPILKTFLEVALTPLTIIFESFAQILQANMPFIQELAKTFSEAFSALAPILAEVAQQFSVFIEQVIARLIPLWQQELPLFEKFIELWAEEFFAAIQQILPYLPQLFDALMQVVIAVTDPEFISSMLQIVSSMLQLAIAVAPLIPQIIQLSLIFLQLGIAAIRVIAQITSMYLSVVGKVQEMVGKVKGFLSGLADIITHPFSAAAGIISGIWDGITSKISGAVDTVKSKLSEAGSFLSSLNPFRAFGGPVEAGVKYTVGEIGPELYVPKQGSPQMIGTGGMEDRSFPGDGMIVPNYMLDMFNRVGAGVEKSIARSNTQSGGVPSDEVAELVKIASESGGATYNTTVNITGDSNLTPYDVETAVEKALRKVEQDRRERQ